MTLHVALLPIVSLAAGLAILFFPRLLSIIVASYLIFAGLAGLWVIYG
ncbi:MAG: DUF3096 domain-containing protein [Gammaproteobacteria bacterium]|jgi:hypothetical protein